jgi:DNA-binding SARP family transcriptional activator
MGPLTVEDGAGGEVAPGGPRLRVLLAALLLHANTPISREALAETMWDGALPDAALESLRSYIRRLRRALGPEAGARIEARDPGYLIRVAPDELDVSRFEELCREAGTALREHAWGGASDAAARALDLWRGDPLLDIPSEALCEQCVPRLEQLRLQALEDRAEADLHLGRHERLVPDLRDLAARHPLRERLHAQLMLALARSGRQAEALEVYRIASRVLADELGVEPGPELRGLHGRILSGDGELVAVSPRSSDAEREGVPRQLPAATRHFTGRLEETDILLSVRAQTGGAGGDAVTWVIDGMAGVGKTALAVHAAHRLAEQFPDGQLFIDLHGYSRDRAPRSPGDALEALLGALGVPHRQIPQDAESRAALYRQRLAGTRTLILLDNAADEAQVRPLLPGDAGCLALVTSRRRLKGLDDAGLLALDVMSEADAVRLVRAAAGPGRTTAEDLVLGEIAEFCGRLPLALRIAAALLRHRPAWSPDHLAGLLRSRRERIGALDDGERDLGAILGLSYVGLTDAQRHLFRHLGLAPGPDIDAYAAAALIDTARGTASHLLEELVDHNLLVQQTPGRYRLHDLIRLYARELADCAPSQDRDAALGRLIDYYRHTACRADALITLYPAPAPADLAPVHAHAPADAAAAWAWLRTERPNLLAAARHTITWADRGRCVGLSVGVATLLRIDGPWSTAVALHAEAAAAAHNLGDDASRAHVLLNLGDARAGTYDYSGAARDVREALELYRVLGDRHGQAAALTLSGEVRRMTGDCTGAAGDLREALELFRGLGEGRGQATALTLSGDVRRMTGDCTGAAGDLREALGLFQDLGERRGQAAALNWLGAVQGLAGDYDGAVGHLHQALRLYRELGERRGQAHALTQLGNAWVLAGDYPGAEGALSDALRLYRELGERRGQANALALLAEVRRMTGSRRGEAAGDGKRGPALHPDGLHVAGEARRPRSQARSWKNPEIHGSIAADTAAGPNQSSRAAESVRRLLTAPDADRALTRFALGEI